MQQSRSIHYAISKEGLREKVESMLNVEIRYLILYNKQNIQYAMQLRSSI